MEEKEKSKTTREEQINNAHIQHEIICNKIDEHLINFFKTLITISAAIIAITASLRKSNHGGKIVFIICIIWFTLCIAAGIIFLFKIIVQNRSNADILLMDIRKFTKKEIENIDIPKQNLHTNNFQTWESICIIAFFLGLIFLFIYSLCI